MHRVGGGGGDDYGPAAGYRCRKCTSDDGAEVSACTAAHRRASRARPCVRQSNRRRRKPRRRGRTRTRRSTSLGGYPAVCACCSGIGVRRKGGRPIRARAEAPNGPVLYWDIGTNGTEVSYVCYYRNYTIKLPCLTPKAPMSNTESSHVQHRKLPCPTPKAPMSSTEISHVQHRPELET